LYTRKFPEILLKFFVSRQDLDLLPTSSTRAKYMEVDNVGVSLTIYAGYFPLLSTANQVWTKFRLFHHIVKTRLCFFKDFSYAAA
jgi:hypothetical protein